MATKVSPFITNYGKELRMGGDIRRKGKVESVTEFVERIKKVYEEAEVALKKTQEKMKRYADRSRKEMEKCVKNERSGLNIFLFSSLIFIFFLVYFPLFYF